VLREARGQIPVEMREKMLSSNAVPRALNLNREAQ
jgi:hypothetical protein